MTDETAPTTDTTADTASAAPDAAATDTTLLGGAGADASGDEASAGTGDAEGKSEAGDGEGDAAADVSDVVPDKYDLSAGEGVALDTDALAIAEPIFRELGLSNDKAQKLTDAYAQIVGKVTERVQGDQSALIAEQRKAWAAEAQADEEIGGKHWQDSISASAKALDALGAPAGSPFRQLLDDSGLGNHPEMIRMFVKIGKAVGEDPSFIDTSSRTPAKRDSSDILYPDDKPKGA